MKYNTVRNLMLTAKKLASRQHRAEIRDKFATIARENGYTGLYAAKPYHPFYRKATLISKFFPYRILLRDMCSAVERSKLPLNVIPISKLL